MVEKKHSVDTPQSGREGGSQHSPEPCLYCEEPTRARVNGLAYCSLPCLEKRRVAVRSRTFRCPFDGCSWAVTYDPMSRAETRRFEQAADEHRVEHRVRRQPL